MSFEQELAAGGDLAYGTDRKSIACCADANLYPECSANDFIHCGETSERTRSSLRHTWRHVYKWLERYLMTP